MPLEDRSSRNAPKESSQQSTDAALVEQLRHGDAEASHRFFREQYPRIFRYLLWLTRCPEMAEDVAQAGEPRFGAQRQRRGPGPGFIRAWRHLARFDDRGTLGAWLHRIAHREFLRFLERQRAHSSLEEVAEAAEPRAAVLTEAVELREVIRKLPAAEGEIVVLHYLQGYNCQEIAHIVRAPVGTVKYRLSVARERLQRELSEGDLAFLNERSVPMRQWDLARAKHLRAHMRCLAGFTPEQRREAMRPAGLAFRRMTLAQQQQFISLALGVHANWAKVELEDLAAAALRVEYVAPLGRRWVAPEEPDQPLRLESRPPISDQERETELRIARRFDPNESEEKVLARTRPEPDLKLTYTIGTSDAHLIRHKVSLAGGGIRLPDAGEPHRNP